MSRSRRGQAGEDSPAVHPAGSMEVNFHFHRGELTSTSGVGPRRAAGCLGSRPRPARRFVRRGAWGSAVARLASLGSKADDRAGGAGDRSYAVLGLGGGRSGCGLAADASPSIGASDGQSQEAGGKRYDGGGFGYRGTMN